jgi:precorrin-2 dehydrogenase/sirohydrochlorin ferrochelatase
MSMRYYPVYLDIQNRNCLVVGGGSVGTRKVETLLKCGAKVAVVSPVVTVKLTELVNTGAIRLHRRPYRSNDLDGVLLVIGATNDAKLNRKISTDADRRNVLCNIADRPQECSFILPAIIARGDLTISISTSGKSPALAKILRQRLEDQFGEEYAVFLQLMGGIRKKLLIQSHEPEAHKELFEKLVNSELLQMIRHNKMADVDSLLHKILGDGYDFDNLMQTENL